MDIKKIIAVNLGKTGEGSPGIPCLINRLAKEFTGNAVRLKILTDNFTLLPCDKVMSEVRNAEIIKAIIELSEAAAVLNDLDLLGVATMFARSERDCTKYLHRAGAHMDRLRKAESKDYFLDIERAVHKELHSCDGPHHKDSENEFVDGGDVPQEFIDKLQEFIQSRTKKTTTNKVH